MKRLMYASISAVMLYCGTSSNAFGATSIDCYSNGSCKAVISGSITRETVAKFEQQTKTGKRIYMIDIVDSPGGDIDAAMIVGRMLRAGNASVFVNGSCASACVVAIAGATLRYLIGRAPLDSGRSWDQYIGIHRPFFTGPPLTIDETRRTMQELNYRLRVYFDEMNVPGTLLDAMNATPGSEMKWITPTELASLGLDDKDPVFAEHQASEQASLLGIDRVEYHRRLSAAKMCRRFEPASPQHCSCLNSVGLPRCK